MSAAMAPSEYLKRPYGRVVAPEPDGTFRAEIIEFPGCLATGETAAEALASLEAVAEGWLEATIARGLPVPEPIDSASYSGKLVVRLGRDLHRRSAHMAAIEGVSLNQFIVSSVAERIGMSARRSVTFWARWSSAWSELAFHLTETRLSPGLRGEGRLVEIATATDTIHVPIMRQLDSHA